MSTQAASRRFIVVTRNFVVAEDLKELLGSFTGSTIDSYSSVEDMWSNGYELAIIEAPVDTLLGDRRIDEMRKKGTKFIVLSDESPKPDETWNGMALISQPFRSGDVMAALDRLGMR